MQDAKPATCEQGTREVHSEAEQGAHIPRLGPASISFPSFVDNTMLVAWRSCKRKHFWSTIHELSPTARSIHLVAGAAIAAGLEAARKRVFLSGNPSLVSHSQILEAAYPAFVLEWGDFTAPDGHAKSFVNTFCALDHYLREFPPATDVIQPHIRPDGTPAVEYRFAIPLDIAHPETSEPIFYAGRFDMIGLYQLPSGAVPCIVDEKSTGSFGIGWSDQWDMRGQFLGYLWALRQQGWRIAHAAVRGIAIQKTQFQIRTALPMYPDFLIERWERQMRRDIKSMVNAYRWYTSSAEPEADAENVYPLDFGNACDSYGGCAYATLCGQRNPEPFFTNYVRSRWNPLARNPLEEQAQGA